MEKFKLPEKLPKKQEKLSPDENVIEKEFGLKEKYDEMVNVLNKVGILELLPKVKEAGIIGIDGKEYPVPTYKEIISKMAERKDFLLKKKEQGFTELLITPFGMSLKILIDRTRKLIIKKHEQGKFFSTNGKPLEISKKLLIDVAGEYKQGNADESGELVYDIKKYHEKNHGGKTKKEILENKDKQKNFLGYRVMFLEDLAVLPVAGRGINKAGRKQLEANMRPKEYLELLETEKQYQGERGLTPEDYLSYLLYYLYKNNQIIDNYLVKGTSCWTINSYFYSKDLVTYSAWERYLERLILHRSRSSNKFDQGGVRVGVPI